MLSEPVGGAFHFPRNLLPLTKCRWLRQEERTKSDDASSMTVRKEKQFSARVTYIAGLS